MGYSIVHFVCNGIGTVAATWCSGISGGVAGSTVWCIGAHCGVEQLLEGRVAEKRGEHVH